MKTSRASSSKTALYLAHSRGLSKQGIDEIRSVPNLDLTVEEQWPSMSSEELAERIRAFDILILSREPGLSDSLAERPGNLKYICYLHGGIRNKIGMSIIHSSIVVTNWGDSPAYALAEGSLVLLYACLKNIHQRVMEVRQGGGKRTIGVGSSIRDLRVGVYGYGFAGKAFVKMLQPLGAEIRIFDPYADGVPEECTRVDSLEELFDGIEALVIHAGLTPETEKSVTGDLLAELPDHGVIVNTARGAIIDQEALFAELKAGRLRAGLDVLDPDDLPPDHEARSWENLIWGCHCFCKGTAWPHRTHTGKRGNSLVVRNLRAFMDGKPLEHVIDETRYSRMT